MKINLLRRIKKNNNNNLLQMSFITKIYSLIKLKSLKDIIIKFLKRIVQFSFKLRSLIEIVIRLFRLTPQSMYCSTVHRDIFRYFLLKKNRYSCITVS